jgi:hypothetical protein
VEGGRWIGDDLLLCSGMGILALYAWRNGLIVFGISSSLQQLSSMRKKVWYMYRQLLPLASYFTSSFTYNCFLRAYGYKTTFKM